MSRPQRGPYPAVRMRRKRPDPVSRTVMREQVLNVDDQK